MVLTGRGAIVGGAFMRAVAAPERLRLALLISWRGISNRLKACGRRGTSNRLPCLAAASRGGVAATALIMIALTSTLDELGSRRLGGNVVVDGGVALVSSGIG